MREKETIIYALILIWASTMTTYMTFLLDVIFAKFVALAWFLSGLILMIYLLGNLDENSNDSVIGREM